jgi:hypothetical protein
MTNYPKGTEIKLEYPKGNSFAYTNGTYLVLNEGEETLDIVKIVDGKPKEFEFEANMKYGNFMYSVIGKENFYISKA